MVSKLVFKGDKTKNKPKKRNSNRGTEKATKTERFFPINGRLKKMNEIDLNSITTGWTILFPIDLTYAKKSIIDSNSGKLPIIITFENEEKKRILEERKTTENGAIKTFLKFTDDFETSDPNAIINYTDAVSSLPITNIEPKSVNQVFILSDVTSLFGSSKKFIESNSSRASLYSIQTTTGKYLMHNLSTNELELSVTLTENSVFTLNHYLLDGIPKYRLCIGENTTQTMVIAGSDIPKVINNEEDVLDSISRFTIKLKCEDAYTTKQILQASYDESRPQESSGFISGNVKKTVLDLAKNGFKLNDKIISEISNAYKSGNLNEWVVEFKEKNVHDRRT